MTHLTCTEAFNSKESRVRSDTPAGTRRHRTGLTVAVYTHTQLLTSGIKAWKPIIPGKSTKHPFKMMSLHSIDLVTFNTTNLGYH